MRTRRVADLVGDRLQVESNDPGPRWSPTRVAVLAHHSERAAVSRSVSTLCSELLCHGYEIVVVSAATVEGPLEWPVGLQSAVSVLRQPNLGYDFGSWSLALGALPGIGRAERVILCNDSLAGPFASLGWLLDRFDRSAADVWGLTETTQYFRHLQSYFIGYRGGVLADPQLARFWAGVCHHRDKQQIIARNELALSRLLRDEGYALDAAFAGRGVVRRGDNPTILGWRRLVEAGFPFVKRELLRDPSVAPDGDGVPNEIWVRYGQHVSDWI